MRRIDLNVDLGEGADEDARLITLATSVNIACGGHAGDAATIRAALALAKRHGVAAGAHPGFEDPEHFGRRALDLPPPVVEAMVARQLILFREIAGESGLPVSHVKPHGALYHLADTDPSMARAVVAAIVRHCPGAAVTVPPQGALEAEARGAGLRVIREGFADRRYGADGRLVSRDVEGAVIDDAEEAANQALELADEVDTLCVHGDGSEAVGVLSAVRTALRSRGWTIAAPGH